MAVPVAVVDANVLYSIELTDLLVTLGTHRLVRLHWSPAILDEVRRNLALRPDLSAEAIDYRLDRMNRALPGVLDEAPPALVESMPLNQKDRHVLGLAVHVEAGTLVTLNLRDFPPAACEDYDVEVRTPDEFLTAVAEADVIGVRTVLAAIAGRRSRAPMSVDQLLDRFARELPSFERQVRRA
ncbi:MAG: PIN domain-containing protein [Acidimicrobiales bacterium]